MGALHLLVLLHAGGLGQPYADDGDSALKRKLHVARAFHRFHTQNDQYGIDGRDSRHRSQVDEDEVTGHDGIMSCCEPHA